MTLVLAVFNDRGVALIADGLGSFGMVVGSQQVPRTKVHKIGDRCAAGEVGDLSVTAGMIAALRRSPLANEPILSRTAEEWLGIAREAIFKWAERYYTDVLINPTLPLEKQMPDARVVLVGVASDRAFAYQLLQTGRHFEPDTDYYSAAGSGAEAARLFLDAFSYIRIADHPVRTCSALAARVMKKVADNIMEIGGQATIAVIHRDPGDEYSAPFELLTLDDLGIRAAVEHWEVTEESVGEFLLESYLEGPVGDSDKGVEPDAADDGG